MSHPAQPVSRSLHELAEKIGSQSELTIPAAAFGDPREQLLLRYGTGTGRFSQEGKVLTLNGQAFTLDGGEDGTWQGTYELVVALDAVSDTPPPAEPPFNRPAGPIPQPAPQAFSRETWRFGDGSSLSVVGPALLHSAKTLTGATVLWISANQLIARGTGRYAGAQGTKTAGISIFVKPGAALDEQGDVTVKTADAFRIVKKEFIGELPPGPPGAAASPRGRPR